MNLKSKTYSTIVEQLSQVIFQESIKELSPFFAESNIILVDKKLKRHVSHLQTKHSIVVALNGSESTKSLATLTAVLNTIFSSRHFEFSKKTKLVVIGGGTLGDFGGFLAHILKRGIELVLVPTTWLSAIDSAHGGKNGINFKNFKNQLGTIYPARQVILVRSLLELQPQERTIEGFGELIKIAYIQSPRFYKKVAKETADSLDLFSYLPKAIAGKYSVVKKDPFETKGIRYILNFGHTIGHVWEAELGIHHGISVLLGMYFDLIWASARGYRVGTDLQTFFESSIVRAVLDIYYNENLFRLKPAQLKLSLSADKKKEKQYVRYVFPNGSSRFKIESVTVTDIQDEFLRQKKLFGKQS